MKKTAGTRAALMIGTVLGSVCVTSAACAQEVGATNGGLEEIIVTAQKREQSVQDVPIAVTALTGDALVANRVTNVTDLSGLAPGVTVRTAAGGSKLPNFIIRGASSFGVVPGSDKQVSIYLDGVYLSNPRGSIFELPDVERIEVLRGPQGTLFGRNATAGAISISTRTPTGEVGIHAVATVGNLDQYRFQTSVNLPQVGPFSAYLSYIHSEKRGDIRNAAAGVKWDRRAAAVPHVAKIQTSPQYLGDKNSDSWFAAVKFESGDFTTVYKYDRTEERGTPEGTGFVGYDPSGALGNFLTSLINTQVANGYPAVNMAPDGLRPDVVNNSFVIPSILKIQGHNLTSTYQASDSVSIKNIFAYRKSYLFATSAMDGFSGLPITPQAAPLLGLPAVLVGSPFLGVASQPESRSEQMSDELQVNYQSDFLTATVGGLWFTSKDWTGEHHLTNTFQARPVPGYALTQVNIGESFNKATSIAAFAQLEFHVTSQLDVILGGRITRDNKSGTFLYGLTPATLRLLESRYRKTKPNYLIGVNYKPVEDIMLYAKYSTAFVSGGNTAGIPFEPETAASWEAGVKADMFDRRLRANLAAYYVTYKHFQTTQSATNFVPEITAITGDPTRAASIGTFVADQGGPVKAHGFELEVTAAPFHGLTSGGSLGYSKTKFEDVNPILISANGGAFEPGIRPKWTAALWAQYDTPPIGAGDAYISARIDTTWQSRVPLTQNASLPAYATWAAGVKDIAPYWMVNGRIAIKDLDVGGIDTQIALWARNLTDVREKTYALYLRFAGSANYVPARSYGVDLTIDF